MQKKLNTLSKQQKIEIIDRLIFKQLPESNEIIKFLQEDKKQIKLGFDPTAPDLHFGHAIPLTVLSILQSLGHHIHVVIGDFTAKIGDPTGKNNTRPPLDDATIQDNAKTYIDQLSYFVDIDKTKVSFNSSWLNQLGASGLITLASQVSVARMLERNDFSNRFKNQVSISLHEFLYPLLQGFDSVAMASDLELGGTDQEFNLLMGRDLQKNNHMKQQSVMMTPILEGLDGVNKMSKSLNNYIAILDTPTNKFGKIMSIPDDLIVKYYKLLTFQSNEEIDLIEKSIFQGDNPMKYKLNLAASIVERFHGIEESLKQTEGFINKFRNKQIDVHNLDTIEVERGLKLPQLIKQVGFATSSTQANQLIKGNAVSIDGQKINNSLSDIPDEFILTVGKLKAAKIKMK